MVLLTVYLKEGTMGKDVNRAMIQSTLVQGGITETDLLENQEMACDIVLFFCLVYGQIY